MFKQSKYSIPFKELSVGSHDFKWTYDSSLFADYPESEIHEGEGEIDVKLQKHEDLLELSIIIEGNVEVICDRCLDTFTMPVYYDADVLVKFAEEATEDDEDIIWLEPNEVDLDLKQYIYESISLSLPYQRVHPDMADCNPEMIDKFRIVSGEEFDLMYADKDKTEQNSETNKNWLSSLTKIKEKLNKNNE